MYKYTYQAADGDQIWLIVSWSKPSGDVPETITADVPCRCYDQGCGLRNLTTYNRVR